MELPLFNCCDFKEGLAAVYSSNGTYGFINKKGKIVSERPYCGISTVDKEDYIVFKQDGKWFIADSNNLTYEVSINLEDKKLKKHFSNEKKLISLLKLCQIISMED